MKRKMLVVLGLLLAAGRFPASGQSAPFPLGLFFMVKFEEEDFETERFQSLRASEVRELAERGDPLYQADLAYMYYADRGVFPRPGNKEKALEWFTRAASALRSEPRAMNALGVLYLYGLGSPQNYQRALHWFRQAARLGHEPARRNLGALYLAGIRDILPRNYAMGLQWLKRVALNGDATAQLCVGVCYEGGYGEQVDIEEAYKWYSLSAAQDYRKHIFQEAARRRDLLEERLRVGIRDVQGQAASRHRSERSAPVLSIGPEPE